MTQADSVHSTPPRNTSANNPLERSAESAGRLYYKTPVTPEEAFQAIGRFRKAARDEIDRLIQFLDKTDDYVSRELEDDDDREMVGDDEPTLGSFDRMADQSKAWRATGYLDAEQDDCDREDCDPDEAKQQPAEMSLG